MISREQLLAHVNKTPSCWLWTGKTDKDGYGTIAKNHTKYRAHRIAFELFVGDPKGMCVLHECDVPGCVNPEHLFLGTVGDNNRDRDKKNRQAKGEACAGHQLTETEVREIHSLYSKGMKMRELCKLFSVSRSIPLWIASGKTWKHLKLPIIKRKPGRPRTW